MNWSVFWFVFAVTPLCVAGLWLGDKATDWAEKRMSRMQFLIVFGTFWWFLFAAVAGVVLP